MSRRRGVWLGIIGVLAALAGCAAPGARITETQRLQAQAAFERGVKAFNDAQGATALTALREAVALDGSVAVYRDTLGLVLLQLQRPDLAAEEFRRTVAMEPKFADAHVHLGIALAEQRQWKEAVESYRKALALPTLTVPHQVQQNLGVALYNLGQYREAEEALRFALSMEPDLVAAYYNLGLVFVAANRPDEAKAAFRRAHELGPDSAFGQAALEQLRKLGEGG